MTLCPLDFGDEDSKLQSSEVICLRSGGTGSQRSYLALARVEYFFFIQQGF